MSTPQGHTILVIEDDESVRRTLQDMLELNGFNVLAAANGQDGYALARRQLPALILTDIEMPLMTGFELLQHLRADPDLRTLPVIVLSAKADRMAMRQGMELGASDFITKPFTEDEVIHSIAARLEKKELVDELDAFAHTVAHDLRSPLTTLSGRLGLASMTVGEADEATMRHQLDEAVRAAHRLNEILEELLVLSGVRRQTVIPEPIDMQACVADAVDRLEALREEYSATVEFPTQWPVAYGHPAWVVEVWVNFISNAAKYGGPSPHISVGGQLKPDGINARFWVQDHGPGLDPAAQAQMFVPFTRISAVRAKGHGLGLSIVRRIVEKLGGQVGVDSAPGAGACFWFELPTGAPVATVSALNPSGEFTP